LPNRWPVIAIHARVRKFCNPHGINCRASASQCRPPQNCTGHWPSPRPILRGVSLETPDV
jgi:hypothetical protein